MPNYAYNTVKARNEKEFTKLKEAFTVNLTGEKGRTREEVDFEKIVPRPRSLSYVPSPVSREVRNLFEKKTGKAVKKETLEDEKYLKEEMKIFKKTNPAEFEKMIKQAEEIIERISENETEFLEKCWDEQLDTSEKLAIYLYNYSNYGELDWYTWSIKNWGTKWNGFSTSVDEENYSIFFETAWDGCEPVIMELARKLEIPLFYEVSEEQFSVFACEMVLTPVGEEVEIEMGPDTTYNLFKIAARMQDEEQMNNRYDPVKGEIVYYDEDEDFDEHVEGAGEYFDNLHVLTVEELESDLYKEFVKSGEAK